MHYSNKEFSRNGADTIQAISDPSMPLGNVNSLSAIDVLQINLLYNCPEALKQGTLIGTQCVQTDCVSYRYSGASLITNRPWKFNRINEVGANSRSGLNWVSSLEIYHNCTSKQLFLISFGINETSISTYTTGHFRVLLSLCFKASLKARLHYRKIWVWTHQKSGTDP